MQAYMEKEKKKTKYILSGLGKVNSLPALTH